MACHLFDAKLLISLFGWLILFVKQSSIKLKSGLQIAWLILPSYWFETSPVTGQLYGNFDPLIRSKGDVFVSVEHHSSLCLNDGLHIQILKYHSLNSIWNCPVKSRTFKILFYDLAFLPKLFCFVVWTFLVSWLFLLLLVLLLGFLSHDQFVRFSIIWYKVRSCRVRAPNCIQTDTRT